MNAQSLQALVIDRHLGELSPEASELLALHLAQHPAAQKEADRILEALAVTGQAVVRHADLAPVGPLREAPKPTPAPAKAGWLTPGLLAKAAAVLLLAAGCAGAGFYAGKAQSPTAGAPIGGAPVVASTTPPASAPRADRPWANYKLSQDPDGGGLRVVRTDTLAVKQPALR